MVIIMEFREFRKIFSADFGIFHVTGMRQDWDGDTRYNRLENPRIRHGLLLLTDDSARLTLPDGTMIQGRAGDLIYLSAGARYQLSFELPGQKRTHPILINFSLTDDQGENVEADFVCRLCKDPGDLLPRFETAAELYKSAPPARLKALVYEILADLFSAQEDDCCLEYIHTHFTQQFSVPELARRCALSETAYRKRFRKLTGKSPIRYINDLKIAKACQMLQDGDISPRQISEFLNFYSLAYFYKVFKDTTGTTPNAYRTFQ